MIPVFVFDCIFCKNSHRDDKYGLVCGAYPEGFPDRTCFRKACNRPDTGRYSLW